MEPQAQVKLEVLDALTEATPDHLPPHAGPPRAHEDAVSSLAGLALPASEVQEVLIKHEAKNDGIFH